MIPSQIKIKILALRCINATMGIDGLNELIVKMHSHHFEDVVCLCFSFILRENKETLTHYIYTWNIYI